MPGKRAHSKNDKYEQHSGETPMNLGVSGPMSSMPGGQMGGMMGGPMGGMHHVPLDTN